MFTIALHTDDAQYDGNGSFYWTLDWTLIFGDQTNELTGGNVPFKITHEFYGFPINVDEGEIKTNPGLVSPLLISSNLQKNYYPFQPSDLVQKMINVATPEQTHVGSLIQRTYKAPPSEFISSNIFSSGTIQVVYYRQTDDMVGTLYSIELGTEFIRGLHIFKLSPVFFNLRKLINNT